METETILIDFLISSIRKKLEIDLAYILTRALFKNDQETAAYYNRHIIEYVINRLKSLINKDFIADIHKLINLDKT